MSKKQGHTEELNPCDQRWGLITFMLVVLLGITGGTIMSRIIIHFVLISTL